MRVPVIQTCGLIVLLAGSIAACSEDPTAPDIAGQYFEAVSLDGDPLPVVIARYSGEGGVLCEESFGNAVLVFGERGDFQLPIFSRVDCGDDWHSASVESRGNYTVEGSRIAFDVMRSATTVPVSAEVDGTRIVVTLRRHDGEEFRMAFVPMD